MIIVDILDNEKLVIFHNRKLKNLYKNITDKQYTDETLFEIFH